MEEAVHQKIMQLIEKVDQLIVEREASSSSQIPQKKWEAEQIQSHIYRLFGIVDCMLQGLGKHLITRFSDGIRKANSGPNELKLQPILGKTSSSRGPHSDAEHVDYFPYYDCLPGEIREQILSSLQDVQDKLNILKVCPNEADLMCWDPIDYEFELIFPLIKKHGNLNAADLYNLSRVKPSFRDVIKKSYETCLRSNSQFLIYIHYRRRGVEYLNIDEYLKTVINDMSSDPEWCLQNPLPVTFHSNFGDIHAARANEAAQRETLIKIGSRLWDSSISVTRDGHLHRLRLLSESLGFTPNLRRLHVEEYWDGNDDIGPEEIRAINNLDLPDLPDLKFLVVRGAPSTLEKLLEKYGNSLDGVDLQSTGMYGNRSETIVAPMLSRLEVREHGSIANFIRKLTRFGMSPLKTIHVEVSGRGILVEFPHLMTNLHEFFGGALEELKICVSRNITKWDVLEAGIRDPTWMADLHFPKMKRFMQCGFSGGWAHLLQFPGLEELCLDDTSMSGRNVFFDLEEVLELRWNREEMLESNIWKFLPALGKLTMSRKLGDVKFEIRRSECIEFQRKKRASVMYIN